MWAGGVGCTQGENRHLAPCRPALVAATALEVPTRVPYNRGKIRYMLGAGIVRAQREQGVLVAETGQHVAPSGFSRCRWDEGVREGEGHPVSRLAVAYS